MLILIKNGVRHITDNPRGDKRYKRIMRTPTYKKPTKSHPAIAKSEANAGTGTIKADGKGGWQLIKPSANGSTVTPLQGYIKWGYDGKAGKGGKPFGIDSTNRKRYSREIARIARQNRLDPNLIHAVISAESGFNPRAVSPAGAMGLMQLMPATAKRFNVSNPFNPVDNMRGGAKYLRWLLNHFKNNTRLALAGYNAGENAVKRYGNKIPPYKETQTYVKRVMQFYNHYRRGRS